ncbi:MAG: L-histidine N(alpha)-methyltransferase [Burkholderiales bacterium]
MNNNTSQLTPENVLFAQDALHGLAQPQKTLPCKWFYDQRGSELFEQITRTPEYYPTRIETSLLHELTDELPVLCGKVESIVELGSGSSNKTRILFQKLPSIVRYVPIDISEEFILQSVAGLRQDFPHIGITPVAGDFTQPQQITNLPTQKNEILAFFPGSTIGNFSPPQATELLGNLKKMTGAGSWLLIGVDMTQNHATLYAGYNDAQGITKEFNLNLLRRANEQLCANFDLATFSHEAPFNAIESRVEMHLRSIKRQSVRILGETFYFNEGETIHTENSYKYSQEKFLAIAQAAGWRFIKVWADTTVSRFGEFLLQAD